MWSKLIFEVDLKYYDLGMERRDALTSVRQDRP